MAQLFVLVTLVASAAAQQGYPRVTPSPPIGAVSTEAPQPTTLPATSGYHGPTAVPVVQPDGHIADTAAVAAARAAHLAALGNAQALWYGGSYNPYNYNYNNLLTNLGLNLIPTYLQNLGNRLYYGPMDKSLGIPKGYIAEAKAAEMAKEAQLRALEKARYDAFLNSNIFPYASLNPSYLNSTISPFSTLLGLRYSDLQGPLNRPYFGPLATPTLLPSGYLADTPEVAAARAAHISTLLRAKALWDAKGVNNVLRNDLSKQQLYNVLQGYKDLAYLNPSLQTSIGTLFPNLVNGASALASLDPAAAAAHLTALAKAATDAAVLRSHQLYKRSNKH